MSTSAQQYTDQQIREAIANHEIGGGAPYKGKVTKDQADFVVKTKQEFRDAIKKPKSIVYIDSDVDWTFTRDELPITGFAEGVTVASGRGQNDGHEPNRGHGAILRMKPNSYQKPKAEERGVFRISKPNVRITGLRLKGPKLSYFDPAKDAKDQKSANDIRNQHLARGISITGDNCEVDNCELYGWTDAAITVGAKGCRVKCRVHHNHIHDCQMESLGYGVDVKDGHTDIRYNYFNDTRHSVNGFGFATCNYTCEYNLFGPGVIGHAVDMHCLEENTPDRKKKDLPNDPNHPGYRYRAGGLMEIRYNTFCFTTNKPNIPNRKNKDRGNNSVPAIKIRGYPMKGAIVEFNRFLHGESEPYKNEGRVACRQDNVDPKTSWQKMTIRNNQCGHSPYKANVGVPIDLTADVTPATSSSKARGVSSKPASAGSPSTSHQQSSAGSSLRGLLKGLKR